MEVRLDVQQKWHYTVERPSIAPEDRKRKTTPGFYRRKTKDLVGRLKLKKPLCKILRSRTVEHRTFFRQSTTFSSTEGPAINRVGTVQPLPYVVEGLKRSATDIVPTW